jgi:hypothetical protein
LEAPYGSPLWTDAIQDLLGSLPLDSYMHYLSELRRVKSSVFTKRLNLAEKIMFDNTILKEKVLKKIPSRLLEAVSYLSTWDELWILFQSPFISAQTRLEVKIEKILAERDSDSLPLPFGGISLSKKYWEGLTLVPDSLEDLEELVLLSKGALALFLRSRFELSKKNNTTLLQSTRLSGAKIKLL